MSGKSFAVVLRDLRQRGRSTIEGLAEASGVSVRAISDMERGRSRIPRRRTVVARGPLPLDPPHDPRPVVVVENSRPPSGSYTLTETPEGYGLRVPHPSPAACE
ncbi:helix-turn-helix domain-containing protein [Streptomyces sp. NPDC001665]